LAAAEKPKEAMPRRPSGMVAAEDAEGSGGGGGDSGHNGNDGGDNGRRIQVEMRSIR
jgi:hypothetical protein